MARLSPFCVVLFDLDGVLRRFEPPLDLEAHYGLKPGSLASFAFHPQFAHPAVRGQISRQQWIQQAGTALGSVPAMEQFLGMRGRRDEEVFALVQLLRNEGLIVGLLTNATDSLAEELEALDLQLDRVFSSAMRGSIKPEQDIFAWVTAELGVKPSEIAFVDDQEPNVLAARAFGWQAVRFVDANSLRIWLEE